MTSTIIAVSIGLISVLMVSASRRMFMAAQPDEWLLRIRNGQLVNAAVGIFLWRWPGDVVARFSSTIQRVSFMAAALTNDSLPVSIEGFILWSVSPEGDAPYRAFRKLGIVNLDAKPAEPSSRKHLLSTPQHHAFQQLLGATAQRMAATMPLSALLRQEELLGKFRESLLPLQSELGIHIDQVELVRVRPAEDQLLRDLSADIEERVKGEAARARLQGAEQAKQREIESGERIAREEAAARHRQIENAHSLRLAQLEHDHRLALRDQEVKRERRLATQASELALAKAALARQEIELTTRLDRIRREAEASRDATQLIASAEEAKSQPVRDYELSKWMTERVTDAFGKLPLEEARWVTVGSESPIGSLLGLLETAREASMRISRATPGAPAAANKSDAVAVQLSNAGRTDDSPVEARG